MLRRIALNKSHTAKHPRTQHSSEINSCLLGLIEMAKPEVWDRLRYANVVLIKTGRLMPSRINIHIKIPPSQSYRC
jgi:hypothetical protein